MVQLFKLYIAISRQNVKRNAFAAIYETYQKITRTCLTPIKTPQVVVFADNNKQRVLSLLLDGQNRRYVCLLCVLLS